jgi:hypothetical protein
MAEVLPRTFKVELVDSWLVRFTFFNLSRRAVDAWAVYVRERDGQATAALRVLYDLRQAGFPTPYATQLSLQVMAELRVPAGTRTAYLVSNRIQLAYYQLLARRMPPAVGEVKVFMEEAAVLKWLRADG